MSLSDRLKRWNRLDFAGKELVFLIIILTITSTFSLLLAIKSSKVNISPAIKPTTAVLVTSFGDITFKFDNTAPQTAANFIKLAENNFYNGTRFNRVVKDFMIQAGDPLTRDLNLKAQWGHGDPGYSTPSELHPEESMNFGTVAMVRNGSDSHGSQFFIVTDENVPWLVGQNTIFGHLTAGADVVRAIENEPTGITGIPIREVILEKVEIQ